VGTIDRVVVQILPHVPRAFVRRFSARYIAGARRDDALDLVARLNRAGFRGTIDVLGEFVREMAETQRAADAYVALLDAIHDADLDSQASVKLTQLGLKLNAEVCSSHVSRLVRHAERLGNLVTIDMEDSSCTDATLDIFRRVRAEHRSVGAVLQACLRRSQADLESLLPLEPNVRICKGIYIEPADIAWQERDEVRRSYLALVEAMLQRPSFVGIATHDEVLVEGSLRLLEKYRAGRERYEFQMLLGVREDIRRRLLAAGHPVRVYVPYGEHWYAYSLRRLKENPAIAGHVLRNLIERRR
jgi:proline dehydrogenase